MNNGHIPFRKMSDLYDDVFPEEEKEDILNHIASCSVCKSKYYKLRRTLGYLSRLKNQDFDLSGLPARTITKFKFRKRNKVLLKTIPAIAAAILVIIGIGIFNLNPFDNTDAFNQRNQLTSNDSGTNLNDSEKVLNIIRNHNAKIKKVSELYIEGEIPLEKFRNLRRDLGFRKVSFSLIVHSSPIESSSKREQIYNWKTNIEEVAVGNNASNGQNRTGSVKQVQKVRFRVYR